MNKMLKRVAAVWFIVAGTTCSVLAQTPDPGLTLDRAVELYLDRNLEVEAARLEVEQVRADRIAASLRPNPSITLTAENFKFAGNPSFANLYEVAASYSETIELGGKRRLRTAVADLGVSVAEARLADILRRGIVHVKQLYYEAVLRRGKVAIASENRDAFEELVQYSQARFNEGAISEADLIKVRLERVQFDRALRQAELARDQTLIRLVERLGESDYRGRRVAGEFQFTPLTYDRESLKAMALDERPDVRAATLGVALARERLALERAKSSPDISPFVGYKRVASSNTVLFGVSIPLPFPTAIRPALRAPLRVRALSRPSSEPFGIEPWQKWSRHIGLGRPPATRSASSRKNCSIRRMSRILLPPSPIAKGQTELLPLIEAQRTQTRVRDQFLQTLFDYQTSILDLELAVGRDLQ